MAGCFVLLTNVPDSGTDALDNAGVLRTYKGQYGVENDFAFLKDPLVVNDLFLKTPARIDALGMILIIALMVHRLMERSMRLYLQQNNQTIAGWDNKPTAKPTAFMLAALFLGVQVMLLKKQRFFLLGGPNSRHLAFLTALGLDATVFLDPGGKCKPIIPFIVGSKGVRNVGRIIQKLYGKCFRDILLSERMETVQYYIQSTKMSLEEIGEKVGYSSSKTLQQAYKKYFGVTPSIERKKRL